MKLFLTLPLILSCIFFETAKAFKHKPAVVLVHGAWVAPSFWNLTAERLRADGYNDIVITDFVSGKITNPPTSTHRDDVALVQEALKPLVRAGKEIIVVMHSYGGLVGSDAIEGFVKKASYGSVGGVIAGVYSTAFIVEPGKALSDYFGGSTPAFIVPDPQNPAYVNVDNPLDILFNDFTDAQAAKYLPDVRPAAAATFGSKAQYAPWKDIPCSYIATALDKAIPPALQKSMYDAVQGQSLRKWPFYEVGGGHASAISKAANVAKLIELADSK
ncbi:alpha/beta-hydrolase [Pseudovirgaria hyperparasitica]|uniref:Alpha/beta-hydrolase n=1 Tax=Pseudovirgaria hyperparasitica TaxID=470096 RepID=A0A6A6WCN2_9PEZI|nr:alpha/beta-hydrolase [Pseudovirgaria hyperparasitica]KAF2760463.1 alpha/beta-hydrolase [Pseudovirgaria hyperparasitica]